MRRKPFSSLAVPSRIKMKFQIERIRRLDTCSIHIALPIQVNVLALLECSRKRFVVTFTIFSSLCSLAVLKMWAVRESMGNLQASLSGALASLWWEVRSSKAFIADLQS